MIPKNILRCYCCYSKNDAGMKLRSIKTNVQHFQLFSELSLYLKMNRDTAKISLLSSEKHVQRTPSILDSSAPANHRLVFFSPIHSFFEPLNLVFLLSQRSTVTDNQLPIISPKHESGYEVSVRASSKQLFQCEKG